MAGQVDEFYDLYLVVHLTGLNKNVLISNFWCDSFDWAKEINEGLNRNSNHLIFFSSDLKKEPDFTLPVLKEKFDANEDHCYFGKIIKVFSKYKSE